MKAAIDSCRRSGGVECGRRARPGRPQERFVREENGRVHVFVTLGDVEPGRIYECRTRWLGPDGGMAMRQELRVIAPDPAERGHSLMFDFWADTPGMASGRWRVEVAVNGELEAERAFEVVAPAPAEDLQAASPRRRA